MRALLERGADPSALDRDQRTPLHHVRKVRAKLLQLYKVRTNRSQRGANPGARDDDQRTPLHLLGCPFNRLLGEGCTTRVTSQIGLKKNYKQSEKRLSKTSEVR